MQFTLRHEEAIDGIHVRELSLGEQQTLQSLRSDKDSSKFNSRMLFLCLVDANGKQLFANEAETNAVPFRYLEAISDKFLKLSGLKKDEEVCITCPQCNSQITLEDENAKKKLKELDAATSV